MFFSKSVTQQTDSHAEAESIEVGLTYENAGEHFRTGRHVLQDVLASLDPSSTVKVLKISGVRLWLSSLVAIGHGDDAIFTVRLPQKLNDVNELNIELIKDSSIRNAIDGSELSILLRAVPNVEKLTISCGEICNSVCNSEGSRTSGYFDFRMTKVELPKLKSCTFTTSGTNYKGERRAVHPGVIQCLLDSAPQLTRDAIELKWVAERALRPSLAAL
jgi:hypothetical protein